MFSATPSRRCSAALCGRPFAVEITFEYAAKVFAVFLDRVRWTCGAGLASYKRSAAAFARFATSKSSLVGLYAATRRLLVPQA